MPTKIADREGNVSVVPGVALEMAEARAGLISNINYTLRFGIPAAPDEPITGQETLSFQLSKVDGDLQLDFREASDKLKRVEVNGVVIEIRHQNEHLVLPMRALKIGKNSVEIEFIAGDTSLNRNPDYLYTLFVPDRARTAFPVFDQPNLKATYDLVLDLPASWAALANGLPANMSKENGRRVHTFARSDKLSSYLFSFVAGEFETITRTLNGREMTMLHRESDPEKIARNVDDIFQAHADALAWMEEYTGIPYPFQKFDFALIPTFQYGGMEHVGAIQYRASTLFLDASPSDPERLNRANLIAHETAHMWFGDLVTMDWFNDVWTKEVFANFMAAKIVNPGFPEIDHDLNFALRSYPAAYAVDRTKGANPIRQGLPNLNEAGTLYGGIIYNKAPIMMRQLELLLGEALFQEGMREYLATYAGGNATWPDLIDILDKQTDVNLKMWSEVWVNTPGRPHFEVSDDGLMLSQTDPEGEGRIWPQRLMVRQDGEDVEIAFSTSQSVALPEVGAALYNANGQGYGLFPVDIDVIGQAWSTLSDLQKGAQLINLYEQMLEGHAGVKPGAYLAFLEARLGEPNELLLNTILGQMRRTYWSFIDETQRGEIAPRLEAALWSRMADMESPPSTRKIYFRSLQDIALSPQSLGRLKAILLEEETLDGLVLSERDRGNLTALLAIKLPEEADALVARHIGWIQNPDAKRRFQFLQAALSASEIDRDAFFASLADAENRAIESWVVDALGYLHHPQRTFLSSRYIYQSLELLEEIQTTGDIFFPARWSSGTLANHKSTEASAIVRRFLAERPDYNYQLKLKILQAADLAFRAEAARGEAPQPP